MPTKKTKKTIGKKKTKAESRAESATNAVRSKKLYRSRKERMIAGICGGLAEYFEVDPSFIRIIFVFSVFLGLAGLVVYIAALFIVPEEME